MKLYVPTVGDAIKLEEDWTFSLFAEYRNKELFQLNGTWNDDWSAHQSMLPLSVTLDAGTILVVSRIYIKKGAEDFDSLTFTIMQHHREDFVGLGFWAKLSDVNTIDCSFFASRIPTNSSKKTYDLIIQSGVGAYQKKKDNDKKNREFLTKLGKIMHRRADDHIKTIASKMSRDKKFSNDVTQRLDDFHVEVENNASKLNLQNQQRYAASKQKGNVNPWWTAAPRHIKTDRDEFIKLLSHGFKNSYYASIPYADSYILLRTHTSRVNKKGERICTIKVQWCDASKDLFKYIITSNGNDIDSIKVALVNDDQAAPA